jgi:hypothetical protein
MWYTLQDENQLLNVPAADTTQGEDQNVRCFPTTSYDDVTEEEWRYQTVGKP